MCVFADIEHGHAQTEYNIELAEEDSDGEDAISDFDAPHYIINTLARRESMACRMTNKTQVA